ncbi:prepilin peptidase [Lacticaseibacillus hulanensis]|uniref:prepilin peptidase n=1 Tax=Lacticaseibacillus hulanensis TaxID=2493111 RepID=UPI000FD97B51|nr:prepilin peptidase [Lacticaseibacillus hulanensis]
MIVWYVIFYVGLILMASSDWRTRSVPAALTDTWLVCMLAFSYVYAPKQTLAAVILALCLALFALVTRGLGSADVIVLTGTVSIMGIIPALLALLLACTTGIIHALLQKSPVIAFIPHLTFAVLCASVASLLNAF